MPYYILKGFGKGFSQASNPPSKIGPYLLSDETEIVVQRKLKEIK